MSEIYALLEELKNSDDWYLQEQSTKIKRYIFEISHGIIPEQLCRSYIQDVRDMIQLNILREEITDKVLAQKTLRELTKLLIIGVNSVIEGGCINGV